MRRTHPEKRARKLIDNACTRVSARILALRRSRNSPGTLRVQIVGGLIEHAALLRIATCAAVLIFMRSPSSSGSNGRTLWKASESFMERREKVINLEHYVTGRTRGTRARASARTYFGSATYVSPAASCRRKQTEIFFVSKNGRSMMHYASSLSVRAIAMDCKSSLVGRKNPRQSSHPYLPRATTRGRLLIACDK